MAPPDQTTSLVVASPATIHYQATSQTVGGSISARKPPVVPPLQFCLRSSSRAASANNSADGDRTVYKRDLAQIERLRLLLDAREAKVNAVLDEALTWLIAPFDSSWKDVDVEGVCDEGKKCTELQEEVEREDLGEGWAEGSTDLMIRDRLTSFGQHAEKETDRSLQGDVVLKQQDKEVSDDLQEAEVGVGVGSRRGVGTSGSGAAVPEEFRGEGESGGRGANAVGRTRPESKVRSLTSLDDADGLGGDDWAELDLDDDLDKDPEYELPGLFSTKGEGRGVGRPRLHATGFRAGGRKAALPPPAGTTAGSSSATASDVAGRTVGEAAADGSGEAPVKRKRGRPKGSGRKNKEATTATTAEAAVGVAPKSTTSRAGVAMALDGGSGGVTSVPSEVPRLRVLVRTRREVERKDEDEEEEDDEAEAGQMVTFKRRRLMLQGSSLPVAHSLASSGDDSSKEYDPNSPMSGMSCGSGLPSAYPSPIKGLRSRSCSREPTQLVEDEGMAQAKPSKKGGETERGICHRPPPLVLPSPVRSCSVSPALPSPSLNPLLPAGGSSSAGGMEGMDEEMQVLMGFESSDWLLLSDGDAGFGFGCGSDVEAVVAALGEMSPSEDLDLAGVLKDGAVVSGLGDSAAAGKEEGAAGVKGRRNAPNAANAQAGVVTLLPQPAAASAKPASKGRKGRVPTGRPRGRPRKIRPEEKAAMRLAAQQQGNKLQAREQ